MALRRSTRSRSGDQLRKCWVSNRPPPQLPGRYKKTPAKKNTSLTASAIKVSGSNVEPAVTDVTNGNKGNSSIKGQQGEAGGNNKCVNSNDADIGKSDGEVSDDNDGDGGIDGNEVNKGGNDSVPRDDPASEDDSTGSPEDVGFVSAAVNKPGPCAWIKCTEADGRAILQNSVFAQFTVNVSCSGNVLSLPQQYVVPLQRA
jgi:hypothetical protein